MKPEIKRFTMIELVIVAAIITIVAAAFTKTMLKTKEGLVEKAKSGELMLGTTLPENFTTPGFPVPANTSGTAKKVKEHEEPPRNSNTGSVPLSNTGSVPFSNTGSVPLAATTAGPGPAAPAPSAAGTSQPPPSVRPAPLPTAQDPAEKNALPEAAIPKIPENVEEAMPRPSDFWDTLPTPSGVPPQSLILTVSNSQDQEVEPFSKYMLVQGSNGCRLNQYRKQFPKDIEALQQSRKAKRANGIMVSVFTEHIRRESVYSSSPYRVYLLRRRLLQHYGKNFDCDAAKKHYEQLADKKFLPCRPGEIVQVEIDGKMQKAICGKDFKLYVQNSRTRRYTALQEDQIPEEIRWRLDAKLLKNKQAAWVAEEVAAEQLRFEQKKQDYIRRMLDAEFPFLADDPLAAGLVADSGTEQPASAPVTEAALLPSGNELFPGNS